MQPRALHSTVTASISGASERTNSHRPTRRDSASRKAAAGCASSDPISRQTAASRSSTLVSGRASTLSSLIKSPFPGTQTAEELLRKNLPGARHNYLQAVARSAADHDHVVAQTHYSTLMPCLDPIHILYQHDYLSYLHCGRAPLLLTSAIPVGLSAVETPVARPVSLAALAAVHQVLRPQPKQQ